MVTASPFVGQALSPRLSFMSLAALKSANRQSSQREGCGWRVMQTILAAIDADARERAEG